MQMHADNRGCPNATLGIQPTPTYGYGDEASHDHRASAGLKGCLYLGAWAHHSKRVEKLLQNTWFKARPNCY